MFTDVRTVERVERVQGGPALLVQSGRNIAEMGRDVKKKVRVVGTPRNRRKRIKWAARYTKHPVAVGKRMAWNLPARAREP